MRRLAKCVGLAVIAVGVLVPAVAWWARADNRPQLVAWVAGPPEQPAQSVGIRVEAEPIQATDVASVLDAWMWRLKVDVPPDTGWKHGWLVVKKRGETAEVFHGGPLHHPDGRPGPWDCLIAITPIPLGATVMSCDKVAVRVNGMYGEVMDNPFKSPAGGMGMQTPKPKFFGNQAILAVVRQHRGNGISLLDSEESLNRLSEYDAVLMLVLTESLDPPPVTAKKK